MSGKLPQRTYGVAPAYPGTRWFTTMRVYCSARAITAPRGSMTARARYVTLATRTVELGGRAIIATFAPDGPERCSGLAVQRYEPEELARQLGPSWRLAGQERHVHVTPMGIEQRYVYSVLSRARASAAARVEPAGTVSPG